MVKLSTSNYQALLENGIACANGVLENWEKGDLARAVRLLAEWIEEAERELGISNEQAEAPEPESSSGIPLAIDPADDRLLCPRCGGTLCVGISEYSSGVPVWAGSDEGYGGVSCDPWDGSHHESEIEHFYCSRCDFRATPEEVQIPPPSDDREERSR